MSAKKLRWIMISLSLIEMKIKTFVITLYYVYVLEDNYVQKHFKVLAYYIL
jgi:hypothetical protein